jgi:hypothetical protein
LANPRPGTGTFRVENEVGEQTIDLEIHAITQVSITENGEETVRMVCGLVVVNKQSAVGL